MLTLRLLAISLIAASLPAFESPDEVYKQGHSLHGQPFGRRPSGEALADCRNRKSAFSNYHQEPRSAAMVQPGQRAAPLVLVLRSGAELPLVSEAGAGQRHGLLGPGPLSQRRSR